jgi:hypothetical protein
MMTQGWTLVQLAGRKVLAVAGPGLPGRRGIQALDPNPQTKQEGE